MYLGEVTRRILLKFAEETGIFGGPVPALHTPNSLSTPDTSKIDHDNTFNGGPTAEILRSTLGLSHWQTFWDRQLVITFPPAVLDLASSASYFDQPSGSIPTDCLYSYMACSFSALACWL